jgi:formamidopyrimidine-DNA glycosylase
MPELPEVETVRRGLESTLLGSTITGVLVRDRRLRWPIPEDFESRVVNRKIVRIDRRSKYLLFRLVGQQEDNSPNAEGTLLGHLGMTGSFIAYDAKVTPDYRPHDHVEFQLALPDSAQPLTVVRYNDPRRFGSMHFFEGEDHLQPLLAHLGPEPLTDLFTGQYLYQQTRRRSGPVKQALMDNTLVVGVGNIYANESLFRAGIHPARAANRISLARYERLACEVKNILIEAIAAGGSTLKDFVNTSGEPGYFQLDYFVYGRGGNLCNVCGNALKSIRQAGRATVFCGACQR